MKNSLGFWAFAAAASFGLLYANHQDLFEHKVLPEVKRVVGVAEKAAEDDPRKAMLQKTFGIIEKGAASNERKDIFDKYPMKAPEFKSLPHSVTPVFVESEEMKKLDKALGFDVSDPGYCDEDPCIVRK